MYAVSVVREFIALSISVVVSCGVIAIGLSFFIGKLSIIISSITFLGSIPSLILILLLLFMFKPSEINVVTISVCCILILLVNFSIIIIPDVFYGANLFSKSFLTVSALMAFHSFLVCLFYIFFRTYNNV